MECFNKNFNEMAIEKIETLSAGLFYLLIIGLMPIGIWCTCYVLFYTKYWYIAVIYLIWIWIIDTHTPEGVSRFNYWVRSWAVFKHAANYFPIKLHAEASFALDPKQNYLACCFPHGVMPTGALLGFQTDACGLNKITPHHTVYGISLRSLFYFPIYRDFILSLGFCNADAKSIERIITNPGGGKIAGVFPGGAAEMFYCDGGEYRIILNNRKGFIKLALRTGAALLPVFSFGETSIYKQKVFPKGNLVRSFQDWLKATIGFPPILFYGRGLFLDAFGLIPMKTPINVLVGHPVEVKQIPNPTEEDIDALHKKFIDKLSALFEEYKHHFEPHPDKSSLIIV